MSIPALDRGLIVIEALIDSPSGLRFIDLKRLLTGITDATLNRLLISLVESGHILRGDSGYALSERVLDWGHILSGRITLTERIEGAVTQISETLKESAGFCRLEEDRIGVVSSRSYPDSISILKSGALLHFEEDHAASLAILSLLEPDAQAKCLFSPHSLIDSREIFDESLEKFNRGKIIADKSYRRPGISRIAIPLMTENKASALFICLPTAAVEKKISDVCDALLYWKKKLETTPA